MKLLNNCICLKYDLSHKLMTIFMMKKDVNPLNKQYFTNKNYRSNYCILIQALQNNCEILIEIL